MGKLFSLVFLVFMCFCLTGCGNKNYDDSITFKGDPVHDIMAEFTYKFTGESEHFAFETGKVFYEGNTRELLISNFKQIKEIKNWDYLKLILSFSDKNLYFAEYGDNENEKQTIENFLTSRVISESGEFRKDKDGNIVGESDSFLETTKDTFKDSIKLEIKYCIKNDCKTEQLKLSYIENQPE